MFQYLGWISNGLLALCYLPQLYETYTSKNVEGLSIAQWIILAIGFTFSLIYCWHIRAWPVFAGQVWGLVCSLLIIIMYFKYKR